MTAIAEKVIPVQARGIDARSRRQEVNMHERVAKSLLLRGGSVAEVAAITHLSSEVVAPIAKGVQQSQRPAAVATEGNARVHDQRVSQSTIDFAAELVSSGVVGEERRVWIELERIFGDVDSPQRKWNSSKVTQASDRSSFRTLPFAVQLIAEAYLRAHGGPRQPDRQAQKTYRELALRFPVEGTDAEAIQGTAAFIDAWYAPDRALGLHSPTSIPEQRRSQNEMENPEQVARWLLESGGQLPDVAAITQLAPAIVADIAQELPKNSSALAETDDAETAPEGLTNPVIEAFARTVITAGLVGPQDKISTYIPDSKQSHPGIASRVVHTAYMLSGKSTKARKLYDTLSQPFARETVGIMKEKLSETIFSYVLIRTGDRHLAEDLVDDVMIRALKNVGIRPTIIADSRGSEVGAWLVTIARNLIFDHVKSSRYKREVFAGDDLSGFAPHTDSVEDQIMNAESDYTLRTGVSRIPSAFQREVLELRFYQGLSVADTASALEIKEGAARALQHRAVGSLRRVLGAYYTPELSPQASSWVRMDSTPPRLRSAVGGVAKGPPEEMINGTEVDPAKTLAKEVPDKAAPHVERAPFHDVALTLVDKEGYGYREAAGKMGLEVADFRRILTQARELMLGLDN